MPETGAPLRRARIVLTSPEVAVRRVVTTDTQGRYEFADLPAGRYIVSASKGGYVTLQYGQRRPFEPGRPVNVLNDQTIEQIDFTLPRGSAITGKVTDEFGEAITGVQVRVQRYMYLPGGQRRLVNGGGAPGSTNDLGEFRVFGLMPGEYIISTVAGGGFNFQQGASGSTDSFEGYAPSYYPGTPNPAEAQPVPVGLGQELALNFSLVAARMARISGSVFDSQGRPAVGAYLNLMSRGGGFLSMISSGTVSADGSFTLVNVSPGEQRLQVNVSPRIPGAQRESASVPVTVAGADINGLHVTTSPGATISGSVVFEGTSARTGEPVPRITMQDAGPDEAGPIFFNGDESDGLIAEDGTFTFKGVAPREVLFRSITPQAWTLKSVTLDGDDITDVPTRIAESAKLGVLKVVLSDRVTDLSGSVVGARGEPLKEYVVVVRSADEKEGIAAARYIRTGRPDQDGRFRIRGLPPGRYLAAAVELLEQGREWDSEFVRRFRDVAKAVMLTEGQALTLSLTLSEIQ